MRCAGDDRCNPDIPAPTTPTPTLPPTTTIPTTTTTTWPGPCLMGWTQSPDTGFCYFAGANMGFDFNQAGAFCQSQGGDLASVHSQAENDFVVSLFPAGQPAERIQIGGIRTGPGNTDADFGNSDGTPFDFSAWGMGEPNGGPAGSSSYCVFMATDIILPPAMIDRGQWNDVSCDLVLSYFAFCCSIASYSAPRYHGYTETSLHVHSRTIQYCYKIFVTFYDQQQAAARCNTRKNWMDCSALTDFYQKPGHRHTS